MKEMIETISLAIAIIFPFTWAVTYVFTGDYKKVPKVYLFILMILASFTYVMTFLKFRDFLEIYGALFPFQAFSVLCLFPLFYLYVKSLTTEKSLTLMNIWPHFVFPVTMLITYLIYQKALISPGSEERFISMMLDKQSFNEPYFLTAKLTYDIGKVVMVVSALFYSTSIVLQMRSYFKKMKDMFSQNDNNELGWIKVFGLMFILMLIFYVIIHLMHNTEVESNQILVSVSFTMFGVFFWYLGLNGFRQRPVYKTIVSEEVVEYDENAKISRDQLVSYIEKFKPYRNPDISVFDFCYHFHTNRTYLADAIKRNFNLNFRGLINYYRVPEAKGLIEKSINLNKSPELDEIAQQAGFSSYSTFFRVFKTELGVTPSEYVANKTETHNL
jgi:AraC-like DNA-binding protein